MERLGLRFRDRATEENFRKSTSEFTQDFNQKVLLLIAIASFGGCVFSIINDSQIPKIFFAVIGTCYTGLALLWKKMGKPREYACLVLSILFWCFALIPLKHKFITQDGETIFLLGFFLALFEFVSLAPLHYLWMKIIFLVVASIIKSIVFFKAYKLIFIGSIIFDISLIFVHIRLDLLVRRGFKVTLDNALEFSSYKSLVIDHIPTSIAIFSENLHHIHITNQAFNKEFDIQNKESLKKDCLNHLFVDVISQNLTDYLPLNELPTINEGMTLDKFLTKYMLKPNNASNEIVIQAFTMSQPRKTYQVKILQISWIDKPALAVVINDISIQAALITMKVSDANKERVIASISHELKTPLNAITSMVSHIKNAVPDSIIQSYCKISERNIQLLMHFLNSILDLQQSFKNKIRLNRKRFRVDEVLDEVKELFAYQCQGRSLSFRILVEPDVPDFIFTDRERLLQILVNLISNSVKFTFKGEITITIQNDLNDQDSLEFIICDTGVGITEKDMKNMFKFLGRVEDAAAVSSSGIGLGLSVSSNLVRLLKNSLIDPPIDVKSQKNKGSTFSFSIAKHLDDPLGEGESSLDSFELSMLYPTDSEQTLEVSPVKITQFNGSTLAGDTTRRGLMDEQYLSVVSPGGQNNSMLHSLPHVERKGSFQIRLPSSSNLSVLNIQPVVQSPRQSQAQTQPQQIKWALVVDDVYFNHIVAGKYLEEKGFKTKTALNGELALTLVKDHVKEGNKFTVILMDLQMPVMDGYECSKKLKELMNSKIIPEMPIIAVSANSSEEDKNRCIECGMFGLIAKPLNNNFVASIKKLGVHDA